MVLPVPGAAGYKGVRSVLHPKSFVALLVGQTCGHWSILNTRIEPYDRGLVTSITYEVQAHSFGCQVGSMLTFPTEPVTWDLTAWDCAGWEFLKSWLLFTAIETKVLNIRILICSHFT